MSLRRFFIYTIFSKLHVFFVALCVCVLSVSFCGCNAKWSESETVDGYHIVLNNGRVTLGYDPASGIKILEQDGYAFKDLNKNGQLDIYEDWRKTSEERAKELASKMTIDQIAGLMLYSSHQSIPKGAYGQGTYNGKKYDEAGVEPFALTDQQKSFLKNDNLRHILITNVESPGIAAKWNNQVQCFVEGLGFGIPANNSSDPRHGASSDAEFYAGSGGAISRWVHSIGLAATFDPKLVEEFGRVASIEYRAQGITTALSPQVDIATDPRWCRFSGTFGESPELSKDMAKAYCSGFQYSPAEKIVEKGWGFESVNAMVKHWPGGGSGEGGRDAHVSTGKFAVFPGNNLSEHMKPFLEGAFQLDNETQMASAVMPYYTISYNQNPSGENVGNGFSRYLIRDQLREKYGYDGVVCTDWAITHNQPEVGKHGGKPWGIETLTEAQRHYMAIMAGVDQFGGNDKSGPILEAYKMGVKEHGEEFMRQRFEQSAVRLLKNIFRVGLFENPYLASAKSDSIVGNPDFMELGFESQLKSFVLLKNKNKVLPLKKQTKVYIPKIYKSKGGFLGSTELNYVDGINKQIAAKYYEVVENPDEAEVALVMINSPYNMSIFSGFDMDDYKKGGNGFVPITLQYREYKAVDAREKSIAYDPVEEKLNRSFKGKSKKAVNFNDLTVVLETKKAMGNKPLIVIINLDNPTIVSEFEEVVDGIVINFNNQDQALLEILSGGFEPSGMLPFQMPANMRTVEEQFEDVPFDMECYIDTEGNTYDFGFGLNWSGQIKDDRYKKYVIQK
jgi:beta-glucosidase